MALSHSTVTCGECAGQSLLVFEKLPVFYWCRYCLSVFTYSKTPHTESATWQLRGFSTS